MNTFLVKIISCCQVTGPISAPSISRDKNEEGTSTGFVTVLHEIIRQFPKAGPRKSDGQKAWKKQDPNRHTIED